MVSNGVAVNGGPAHKDAMTRVFPEALKSLKDADPELAAILKDEKKRQW